ncbi:UNVERIFIED_CONTAM: methyl-accepting chemotaxis protein [Halobacillus marinus]|uniref:methyl-accepting chemotaxis protein n=2 Tax=Bacillales TaxID=1385 RepID=UPI0002A4D7A7|nr:MULTISPECIES: methyl-accepting chemotaxis protein [Bacillaceae]ELK45465.1 methyl-accepting chemotaxis protein [Halobacillus sp. BAB-2008]QHT47177.1 methyl-accepting chemotaxis protein [Bacillus sp. SB49]
MLNDVGRKFKQRRMGSRRRSLSFQWRLSLVLALFLLIAVILIGFLSYSKAKESQMQFIQDRLDRELVMIQDISKQLMYAFVGEEEQFQKRMQVYVNAQQAQLVQDGLDAEMYLLTDSGIITYSSNREEIFPEEYLDKIKETESGTKTWKVDGEEILVTFAPVQELQGIYIIRIPAADIMEEINNLAAYIFFIGVLVFVLTVLVVYWAVKKIVRPLNRLEGVMDKAGEGTLKDPSFVKTTIPEIQSLKKSYSKLISKITGILSSVTAAAHRLGEGGEGLRRAFEGMDQSRNKIIQDTELLRESSRQTICHLNKEKEVFQDLTEMFESLQQELEVMWKQQEAMKGAIMTGQEGMNAMDRSFLRLKDEIEEMRERVGTFERYMSTIKDSGSLIQAIAEQTRMLALNASIEVGRTEGEGRGFHVIAEEIRKLADRSKSAAIEIDQRMKDVLSLGRYFSDKCKDLGREIETQERIVDSEKDSFHEIMTGMESLRAYMDLSESHLITGKEVIPKMADAQNGMDHIVHKQSTYTEDLFEIMNHHQTDMRNLEEIQTGITEMTKEMLALVLSNQWKVEVETHEPADGRGSEKLKSRIAS